MSWRILIVLSGLGFLYFVAFNTGPEDLSEYPAARHSRYRLPWTAGVSRLVSQGNRSFSTHRGYHHYSWDFWMSVGTPVLAARDGYVVTVTDHLDGIGFFKGNEVVIEHSDLTRAVYGHIQTSSAKVRVGERIFRGQHICNAGMVGATINPHLHFHVIARDGSSTVPIAFSEVDGGVPLALGVYESKNQSFSPSK